MKKKAIKKKFNELKKELAKTGFICTGSVFKVYQRCGKKSCSCATDKNALHGPYNRWTRKLKGKTISRTITDEQAEITRKYIENYRNLEKLLEKMKDLTIQYIELHKSQEIKKKNTKKA
jgi:hypothetical protein